VLYDGASIGGSGLNADWQKLLQKEWPPNQIGRKKRHEGQKGSEGDQVDTITQGKMFLGANPEVFLGYCRRSVKDWDPGL